MKRFLSALLSLTLTLPLFVSCGGGVPAQTTAKTDATADPTAPVNPPIDETLYNTMTKQDYRDRCTAGFLGQIVGFLSDYKYVWKSGSTPRVALPDEWFPDIINGCDSGFSRYEQKIVKLLKNEQGEYEVWIADCFSIDILDQYILRDSYNKYGCFTTKTITEDWLKYSQWDMGGGQRFAGAYYLANKYNYLSPYLGSAEYGNRYPWCQEPWIGNDSLGLVSAGMPNLAVDLTDIFGRVTGDSDNVLWLNFMATMESLAFFESDIPTLIRKAAKLFPAGSYEESVVNTCFELFERFPDNWRTAIQYAEKKCSRGGYYYHTKRSTNVQGQVDVNMAFIILALLYGKGDYTETAKICSLSGYDTRGTLALPILGIIGGMDILPERVNTYVWHDGEGVIVNRAVVDNNGYWMQADNLPERYKITEIIDLYVSNFETLLVENGGIIEGDTYYIPKTTLDRYADIRIENGDFESGFVTGFTAIGDGAKADKYSYWGNYAAKITAGTADNGISQTVKGLAIGKTYRMTAYVIAGEKVAASLFARDGSGVVASATVRSQTEYVKRDLVFTATAETMELGILVRGGQTAGDVYCDEIVLTQIEETLVAGVEVTSFPTEPSKESLRIELAGKLTGKQVYVRVTFHNDSDKIVNAAIRVNGQSFCTVPLYKTAAADNANVVYIPVVLNKEKNAVILDLDGTASITAVSVITRDDRTVSDN